MSKIKVVLVNAKNPADVPYVETNILHQHLGIAYLKAVLASKGYSVKLVDCDVQDIDNEQALSSIVAYNPHVVGFTATWTNLRGTIILCQQLKDISRRIATVIGGHHATLDPGIIEESSIDFLVRGEGELTLSELIKAIESGTGLNNILGLTFKENGRIIHNPPRPVIEDLDSLPFPARDQLREFIERVKYPLVNVCTSRGCHFNCSYCTTPAFHAAQGGKRWRARSATNVVDELEYLNQEYGITYFLFADDNFVGTRGDGQKRAARIAKEILRRGLNISFVFMCRSDSFDGAEHILPLLKKAGLRRILVGIESGSDCELRTMNKSTNARKTIHIADLLESNNIILYPGFINFTPYTTIEDLHDNAELMFRIKQAARMTTFCHKISLFPGTPLFEKVRDDGMVVENGDSALVSYKFMDERLQPLVDAMARLYPHVLDNDRFLVASLVHFASFKERFKTLKEDVDKQTDVYRLGAKIRESKSIYEKMNEVSYKFISKAIDLAEEGWSDRDFEMLSSEYLQKVNNLVGLLKGHYLDLEGRLGPMIGAVENKSFGAGQSKLRSEDIRKKMSAD